MAGCADDCTCTEPDPGAGLKRGTGPGAEASPGRRDRGFALLIVLLALTLLGLVTARLLGAARTQIAIAGNLRDAAVARAAAEGGIAVAIVHLEAGGAGPAQPAGNGGPPRGLWHRDGARHDLAIGQSRVAIRIARLSGRVNPTSAPPALLDALLRTVGIPRGPAARLAAAVVAWRSPATSPAAERALEAAYRHAGRAGGPDARGFPTIDALGAVLGMTPRIVDRLRPHLSLAAPAVPRWRDADPVVRAALRLAGKQALDLPGGEVERAPVAEIESVARGPGRARAARCAAIRLSPANLDAPYRILSITDARCPARHDGDVVSARP